MAKDASIFSVRFGVELGQQIDQISEELDISKSQLVKKAVKHFIARQRHIDELLLAARMSDQRFRQTGLAVPFDEASVWLRSGGNSDLRPTAGKISADD